MKDHGFSLAFQILLRYFSVLISLSYGCVFFLLLGLFNMFMLIVLDVAGMEH